MKLPVKYSLKSVVQRPLRSLLTILGVGLAVFLSVMMLGMSRGLVASTVATGEELNVLVLSKGAESIEFSALDPLALKVLENTPGLTTYNGQPLVSPEVTVNSLVGLAGSALGHTPVLVRGVLPGVGLAVHPQVQIAEGHAPQRGYEVTVGPLVATRLGVPEDRIAIGDELEYEGQRWTVVGKHAATGTAFEAEIWTHLDDLMVASRRDDYSSLVMAADSVKSRDDIIFDLETRTDVRSTVHVESDYYAAGVNQARPVQAVAYLMTVLLMLGGLMAGMNTMFNSIMGRTREMAVLQVMGYRRSAVLTGFVLESLVICLVGGILGSSAALALNGLPMKFSMGAFRFMIDPLTLAAGLVLALVIGLFGASVPVLRVARLNTVEGLRMQA